MGKFLKLRDRKSGWESLNASGENAKTRDVYNSQQFERSSIDKPQTMTTRMIIIIFATVFVVLFTWFLLSACQYGMASFNGFTGGDDSGATAISDASSGSGSGDQSGADGQDGTDPYADGLVDTDGDGVGDRPMTAEEREFFSIQRMDWPTYKSSYYVQVGGEGSMVHSFQSLIDGRQYTTSEIYDNYFAMVDGDYDTYLRVHSGQGGQAAPAAGDGGADASQDAQAGQQGSDMYDKVRNMDWDTYKATFYTKEGNKYLNAGDGQYYSAGDLYDNYMAIQGGDYVLYARLHGALESQVAQAGESAGVEFPQDAGTGTEPAGTSEPVGTAPVAAEPSGSEPAAQAPVQAPAVPAQPDSQGEAQDMRGEAGQAPVIIPQGGEQSGFGQSQSGGKNYFLDFALWKVLITFFAGLITFAGLYVWFKKNLEAQNQLTNVGYLNQYHNDQHIQLPEEVQRNYDWFPDVGAHAPVQVSSMISHVMLLNKGIKKVLLTKRAKKDMTDEAGDVVYYKGERLLDDEGNPIVEEVPMFDDEFGHGLFSSANVEDVSEVKRSLMDTLRGRLLPDNFRIFYDARDIPYNPGGKNRDKLKDAETVADMINKYWEFPEYEPQRPGGAYLIDTAPVNTMLLAITRAGKG